MANTNPLRIRTSIASTHSLRQRKFSTDRLQRQAHQSILNEETQKSRQPIVNEESIDNDGVHFSAPDFENLENIKSMSRAGTGLSPLEVHPGQLATKDDLMVFRRNFSSFAGPFPEPNDVEQSALSRNHTGRVSFETERAPRRAPEPVSPPLLKRLYQQLKGARLERAGALKDPEHVPGLEGSLAFDFTDSRTEFIRNRQVLYVLEYDKGRDGMPRCTRPNDAKSYDSAQKLREYLNESASSPMLRIIYACNTPEAVDYLTEAFSIDDGSYRGTEKSFRDWIHTSRTQRGASNKVIKWRPSWDQARGVIGTAFGLDFGSIISHATATESTTKASLHKPSRHSQGQNRAELKESQETLQRRISVYLQRELSAALPGPRVMRFKSGAEERPRYAKANTMIIFEYSSGKIGEIVKAPELLDLYPGHSVGDHTLDSAAPWIMEGVLIHIYDRVFQIWQDQISSIHEDHARLEGRVFDDPSNERLATEVWTMLEYLHDMAKLLNRHEALIDGFQENWGHFTERDDEQDWLDTTIGELADLGNEIQKDYIELLNSLIDLIYKSVTIRDSRQALDLSASLWRLSWITFIFLPLTFLSGFFGMNVDLFKRYPSIKWYFVGVVSLMAVVWFLWFALRQVLPASYAPRSVRYSNSEVLRLRNAAGLPRVQQSASYPRHKATE